MHKNYIRMQDNYLCEHENYITVCDIISETITFKCVNVMSNIGWEENRTPFLTVCKPPLADDF